MGAEYPGNCHCINPIPKPSSIPVRRNSSIPKPNLNQTFSMQQDANYHTVATATHDAQERAARIIQRAYRESRVQSPSPICLDLPVDHANKGLDVITDHNQGNVVQSCIIIRPGTSKKIGTKEDAHTCSVEELCVSNRRELFRMRMFAVNLSSGHFEGCSSGRIAQLCGSSMEASPIGANYMREEAAARTIQRFFRKAKAKRAASQTGNV